MILTSLAIQLRMILSWTASSQASRLSMVPSSSMMVSWARRQKRRVGREAGRKGR